MQRGIFENPSLTALQITLTQYYRQSNIQSLLGNGYIQNLEEFSKTESGIHADLISKQALSHKREDSKNFYHHSTIYNVKEFKELSKPQDYQEPNLTKYTEMQTKIMVADFKKKVDAFLQKNNQKTNMIGSKIPSSLYEFESFQSTNNEEQLNKSLCSNKYTIRTEYKSMKATEIFVISNSKVVSRQIISSELIQQRLLKQMEIFLKDDRYNYDLKMHTMIDQYEDIVNRIRQQTYTIRLPQNYEIQMSDYNEFYQKKEEPQIPSIDVKLDLLADQIIQEIQQSRQTTPQMQSQINEDQQEEHPPYIDEVIKTEPIYLKEEETPKQMNFDNEQVRDRKLSQRKGKPRKQQQQQQQQLISDTNNLKSQQSSQSELPDITSTQQIRQTREILQKLNKQQIIQPIQIQQQNHHNFETNNNQQIELTQNQHQVQNKNKNKKHINHDKQKGKVHSRKIAGDTAVQRQVPIYLDVPKEQILETLSEKSHEETCQFEEIQNKKQESLKQEHQDIKQIEIDVQDVQDFQQKTNQQTQPILIQESIQPLSQNKQLHHPEQRDAVEIWDNNQPVTIKSNPKPKPYLQENKQIEQISKGDRNVNTNQQYTENELLNQRTTLMTSEQQQTQQEVLNYQPQKSNQNLDITENNEPPQTNQLLQINKDNLKNQIEQQEEQKCVRIQEEIIDQTKEQNDDLSKVDYLQIINEKMKIIEQKLFQPSKDIFDILLASDLVYNVDIENYKVSKSYKKQVFNSTLIFQQKDEEVVYSHQIIWRHELLEVIPKLQNLNKQIEIDEYDDDYSGNYVQEIEKIYSEFENQLK